MLPRSPPDTLKFKNMNEEEWFESQLEDAARYDGEQAEKEWAEYEAEQAQKFESNNQENLYL
jgi:hypothetical protein